MGWEQRDFRLPGYASTGVGVSSCLWHLLCPSQRARGALMPPQLCLVCRGGSESRPWDKTADPWLGLCQGPSHLPPLSLFPSFSSLYSTMCSAELCDTDQNHEQIHSAEVLPRGFTAPHTRNSRLLPCPASAVCSGWLKRRRHCPSHCSPAQGTGRGHCGAHR